jgi:hypothetical protein
VRPETAEEQHRDADERGYKPPATRRHRRAASGREHGEREADDERRDEQQVVTERCESPPQRGGLERERSRVEVGNDESVRAGSEASSLTKHYCTPSAASSARNGASSRS